MSENRAAFVVFQDEQGRFWGKQSIEFKSKWLPGNTPDAWAKAFYQTKRVELLYSQENTQELADDTAASSNTATP